MRQSFSKAAAGLLVDTAGDTATGGVPEAALNELPRVILTERSAVLKESILTFHSGGEEATMDVVPAEFGAIEANLTNVPCIVRDECFQPKDVDTIQNYILVLLRGEISFAEKARLAQQRGASGLIVVNDRPSPWPYIMTDSTNQSDDIYIPVVMVPQGKTLPKNGVDDDATTVSLRIQENTDLKCCVCTEAFRNTIVIQLPKCHHRFHDACALPWLASHNSCPYCRSVVW